MSPFERALVELGANGREAVAQAHVAAIAIGGNFTGTTHESELTCSAQDLLCLAGNAAVDAAMVAQVFEVSDGAGEHAELLREISAGMARLVARALEIHARDTGYDPEIWNANAVEETEIVMCADSDPLFDGAHAADTIALVRTAAAGIHAALACAPADRMGVPGHVASALGACVAMFMVAEAALNDG